MSVGLLTLHLRLFGCASLKEKRGRIKPILARLHREFNISAAEVDRLDHWQEAVIACAVVSNDPDHSMRLLQSVVDYVGETWPDETVIDQNLELL